VGRLDSAVDERRRLAHLARGQRLDVGRIDVAAVDELRPVAVSRASTWTPREASGSTWAGSTSPVDELRPVAAVAHLARGRLDVTGSTPPPWTSVAASPCRAPRRGRRARPPARRHRLDIAAVDERRRVARLDVDAARGHRLDVAAVDELRPVAASRTWRETTGSTWDGSTSRPWTSCGTAPRRRRGRAAGRAPRHRRARPAPRRRHRGRAAGRAPTVERGQRLDVATVDELRAAPLRSRTWTARARGAGQVAAAVGRSAAALSGLTPPAMCTGARRSGAGARRDLKITRAGCAASTRSSRGPACAA
jgi:hypothetical protein